MTVVELNADTGFAVKRNGTLLIRTASETDWQAMGNGLVLVFDAHPARVDWAHPEDVRAAFAQCVERSDEQIEVVACRITPA